MATDRKKHHRTSLQSNIVLVIPPLDKTITNCHQSVSIEPLHYYPTTTLHNNTASNVSPLSSPPPPTPQLWKHRGDHHRRILHVEFPQQMKHHSSSNFTLSNPPPKAIVFGKLSQYEETPLHSTAQQHCISKSSGWYSNYKVPQNWLNSATALLRKHCSQSLTSSIKINKVPLNHNVGSIVTTPPLKLGKKHHRRYCMLNTQANKIPLQ